MGLDKLERLHEHATRSAAGVINLALIRFEHLHQQRHYTFGRVVLAASLAFIRGKFT